MPAESGTTLILAPPEVVFNYLADPANLPAMLASNVTVRVEDIQPLPNGGYRYHWDYHVFGVRMRIGADAEVVEFEPPHRFAVRSFGSVETLSAWDLEPHPQGTQATFSISYESNSTLLARLSQRFIASQIRYAVEVALFKVKELVETEARRGQGHERPA